MIVLKDLMAKRCYQKLYCHHQLKNFYDQPIDSDIKQYEEGEDYTTGYLLDYEYIKNHHILITVDSSRQLKNTDGVNADGTQSIKIHKYIIKLNKYTTKQIKICSKK